MTVRDDAGPAVPVSEQVLQLRIELAMSQKSLERERLRVTLRAMAEGLLTTDTAGVVQFMNEAAERLTGWTSGTAVGRSVGRPSR